MHRTAAATGALLALLGLLTGCAAPMPSGSAPRTAPPAVLVPASPSASGAGCAATGARVPAEALTSPTVDVDGDGRADAEWAQATVGGGIRVGVRTASGAVVSAEQDFAGGGSRSAVVGRLANGVVLALVSEGRASVLFSFSGCAFHPVLGRDRLPGSRADQPFTLYTVETGGAGGCFDGHLDELQPIAGDGGRADVRGTRIDVDAGGRRATLTSRTDVLARGVDFASTAAFRRWNGISCAPAKTLFPVVVR